MRYLTLVLGCLGLCGCPVDNPLSAAATPAVFSTRLVSSTDASGVGTVTCPSTHRVVGGGCSCEGVSDVLFGAEPAGNGFVCACYDFGARGGGVSSTAICMSSTVAGTLTQGLTAPDPETQATAERFRALRAAQR